MKRIFTLMFIPFAFLGAKAQQATDKVPLDNRVVTGKLANGLQYFIMHNEKPEDKVEMRLVVNAGSVLERDDQQGLAHFLEHMAFNGSEHFKKNELVDYLQSAGVKFGAHLNAYTSFDETVYMLSLPTADKTVMDKGYLILEDWASHLLLEQTEIVKERGVVLEEFRLGLGAEKRMMKDYLPKLLYNSKYAERLPIGKKEILQTFSRDALESFYTNWYRPDLMAIVVVGNIDVQTARKKIEEHFGKLKNPKEELKRVNVEVPDHTETFVSTTTDPEASYGTVQFYIKQKGMHPVAGTKEEHLKDLKESLFFHMLNERIDELRQKPEAAFSYGGIYTSEMFARGKNALQGFAVVSQGQYQKALEQMLTELQRAKKFGFSEAAFERAKTSMRTGYEGALKEKNKTESRQYAGRLVSYFLDNNSFASPEWGLEFFDKNVKSISLAELNHFLDHLIIPENRVVIMTGPESDKSKMPDEATILSIMNGMDKLEVQPIEEEILPNELMVIKPMPGKVVSNNFNKDLDAYEIILSNGAKILYKHTDLKNDQILFSAISKGGTNLLNDADYKAIHLGLGVLGESGVASFSNTNLQKMLAGKRVSLNPYIYSTTEGFNGSCRPEDFETMLQLLHLYMKQPRWDNQAFESFIKQQRSFYDNMSANPNSYFSVKWNQFTHENDNRAFEIPNDEDWKATDYSVIKKVYEQRFSNAGDFTYMFVGNLDVNSITQLVERYIGSLKGSADEEQTEDLGSRYKSGTHKDVIVKGSEPKSRVQIEIAREIPYSEKLDLQLEMISEILDIRLIEVLREEMSGVYGISSYARFSRIPYENMVFTISFPCGPEKVDELIDAAMNQLQLLGEAGPTEKNLNKAKQAMTKEVDSDVQNNRYWLNRMMGYALYQNVSMDQQSRKAAINAMTADELKKVVKQYLIGDHLIGILMPENTSTDDH
ncbi:MAG: insulinase family protein [Bacteroidetes bacterium]|nr:insulinase family protein [Bacteroidota bacterium]